MNRSKLSLILACLALTNAAYGLLNLSGARSPEWWTAALLGAVCLALFALLVRRYVLRSGWLYRLYRRGRDEALSGVFHLPRRPGLLERLYLRVSPPRWCKKDDLIAVFKDREKLLTEGRIVLAVLVQANARLFERGVADHPANVLYTTEPDAGSHVADMLTVAHRIFSLKNTKPEDPDESRFARMVSYELGRDFRVTVPERLSGGLDLTYTTIMAHRKHLPEGRLMAPYFPLVIHDETRAAMILPARYWPEEFLEGWVRLGEGA